MSYPADCFHGKSKRQFLNQASINPHLTCSICLDIFQEPHRLICGHTFCYICIQHWAKTNKKTTCAECKRDFSRRRPEKDLIASKMVDQLEVKCMHPGCNWRNINSVLKKHQRVCDHRQKKQQKYVQDDSFVNVDEVSEESQIVQIKSNDIKFDSIVISIDQIEDDESNPFSDDLEQAQF